MILGRSNLFIFEIVKPGTSSRTGAGELAEQQNGGWNALKAAQISRLQAQTEPFRDLADYLKPAMDRKHSFPAQGLEARTFE